MITSFEYGLYERYQKVYENSEAMVVVMPNGYMAIQKYPCTDYCYGENYRSTKGSLERCKKAFEKYSPKTMKALGI